MNKEIKLPFVSDLKKALAHPKPLIQVVLGPRQVGKTTGVKQLLKQYKKSTYCSADGVLPKSSDWILEKWTEALQNGELLVIDEIQKIENWSEAVKKLWDEQADSKDKLKLILLGSSSLQIQQGLTESITGRFQLHRVFHWSFEESQKGYGLDLDSYLQFGGYPGSYRFTTKPQNWVSYVQDSIIDTVIGKDILDLRRVKSPALFKQCFDLVCSYAACEISYSKLLGQLQDKGNTDLVKHYLELFEMSFLIKQLFKYSSKPVLTRSSSPKILPLCPALFSVGLDAQLDSKEQGRSFEVAVGASLARLPGTLSYWREKNDEVDFVYSYGKFLAAIQVKSSKIKKAKGLEKFKEKFPKSELYIITKENYTKTIKKLYESHLPSK